MTGDLFEADNLGNGASDKLSVAAREQFDWLSDDSVILPEQPATAVYTNKAGSIVIRQQAGWDDDGDHFVILGDRTAVQRLIDALKRELAG